MHASCSIASQCSSRGRCRTATAPTSSRCTSSRLRGRAHGETPSGAHSSCRAALPGASASATADSVAAAAAPRSLSSTEVDVDTQVAYELVQGALVRWSHPTQKSPPTAVLVHGILGSRRNMASFAKMLVEVSAWGSRSCRMGSMQGARVQSGSLQFFVLEGTS